MGLSKYKFRLKIETSPQTPTCFSYKVLQKRTTKKKTESEEEYNGIWKIKAKLLQDKTQKLKRRKLKIITPTSYSKKPH